MAVILVALLSIVSGVISNETESATQEVVTLTSTTPLPLWTPPGTERTIEETATTLVLSTSTPATSLPPPPGCPECGTSRCPQSAGECFSNVGLVKDPCECCSNGICGLKEGAQCFADSLANELLPTARALGACGQGMECVLRTDLLDTDHPEALCSCLERGPVCGTDNRTYSSSCQLAQDAERVWLRYRGPCRAAPRIVSPPEPESSVPLGGSLGLSCESKGCPTPRLHWERVDVTVVDTDTVSHLPDDDPSVSVQLRGGPEPFMTSAWLQISEATKKHAGAYACVAVNTEGEARAIAILNVTSISEDSGG